MTTHDTPSGADQQTLVLVALPGVPLRDIGIQLAAQRDQPVWHVAELIAEVAHREPADVLVADGEPAYRELETATLKWAVRQGGVVVADAAPAALRPPITDDAVVVHVAVEAMTALRRSLTSPSVTALINPRATFLRQSGQWSAAATDAAHHTVELVVADDEAAAIADVVDRIHGVVPR